MTAALLAARGAAERFRLPSRPLVAAGIAVSPARLGEPLRAGLVAARLPDGGRAQAVAGAWALVGAARAGVSAALLAAAAAAGLVPVWLAAIPALAALALAGMRAALGRAR